MATPTYSAVRRRGQGCGIDLKAVCDDGKVRDGGIL
jgi:hypothetical protein